MNTLAPPRPLRADADGLTASYWSAVALLVVVGVLFRLIQIGYNFDNDEIWSTTIAGSDLAELLRRSLADRPHPPLHNLLLHGWIGLFGASEVSVRLLSVAASALFLGVLAALARSLMDARSALVVVAIAAVGSFFVYYGQTARPYAFALLFGTLNLWLFVRLLAQPASMTRALAWGVSIVPFGYSQYFAGLTLATELAWLATMAGTPRWRNVAIGVAGGAAVLPWMAASFLSVGRADLSDMAWVSAPGLFDLVWLPIVWVGHPPAVPTRVLLLVFAVLLAPLVWATVRARLTRAQAWLIAVVVFPTAVAWIGPHVAGLGIWAARQLAIPAVAFVVLLGVALSRWPRTAGGTLGILLFAWALAGSIDAWPQHAKPPLRDIATAVQLRSGDRVAIDPADHLWLHAQLRRYGLEPVEVGAAPLADDAAPLPLVCRPEKCEALAVNRARYLPEPTRFPWTTYGGEFTNRVLVYWPRPVCEACVTNATSRPAGG